MDDLGFDSNPSLSIKYHIGFITYKAFRTLDFIHRNALDFDQANYLKTLYTSLVRSVFEYGSSIWSPYSQIPEKPKGLKIDFFHAQDMF